MIKNFERFVTMAWREWVGINLVGSIPYDSCLQPPWIQHDEVKAFRCELKSQVERSVDPDNFLLLLIEVAEGGIRRHCVLSGMLLRTAGTNSTKNSKNRMTNRFQFSQSSLPMSEITNSTKNSKTNRFQFSQRSLSMSKIL